MSGQGQNDESGQDLHAIPLSPRHESGFQLMQDCSACLLQASIVLPCLMQGQACSAVLPLLAGAVCLALTDLRRISIHVYQHSAHGSNGLLLGAMKADLPVKMSASAAVHGKCIQKCTIASSRGTPVRTVPFLLPDADYVCMLRSCG